MRHRLLALEPPYQFVVTGLFTAGLFSTAAQWVVFLGAEQMLLCKLGVLGAARPALIDRELPRVMTPSWVATPELEKTLAEWATELRGLAKECVVLPQSGVRSVLLHLRMWQHRFVVTPVEGPQVSLIFLDRERATGHLGLVLRRWLDARFELRRSPVYSALERVAPVLTR